MIKAYRYNRRIICYIRQVGTGYKVCTGKPSDACCISWKYASFEEAKRTAEEFYNNYIGIL